MLSFENTEYAFAYKSDKELSRANFVFSMMRRSWLVNFGIKFLPSFIKWHIPLTIPIVRTTIFKQFAGGETLQQTSPIVDKLKEYNVQVILDYGVESGKKGEAGFDAVTEEFIRIIEYASTQTNIPFISIKITSIARFDLLKRINNFINSNAGTLSERHSATVEKLRNEEKEEWRKVNTRMNKICATATDKNVRILIDAEESWIQNSIDHLAESMMLLFNKKKTVVYTTVQLYRIDGLDFLKKAMQTAIDKRFILGVKIVRGAYMEKERERALSMSYASPIQPDKESCDKAYNEAIDFCTENLKVISLIVASHNEQSCLYATELLQQKSLSVNDINFAQLYGMSDHITFNLAKAGYSVSKYLPLGPIKEVIPYLMRRAQENSSVNEQTGREIGLIKKEIERRSRNKE
ncbi:MAG TPA: proline dehydrogenase family protein [Ferruginibacter sp.]|nr:proline dehydrogenase family protein [Ferruginibacter sp.]